MRDSSTIVVSKGVINTFDIVRMSFGYAFNGLFFTIIPPIDNISPGEDLKFSIQLQFEATKKTVSAIFFSLRSNETVGVGEAPPHAGLEPGRRSDYGETHSDPSESGGWESDSPSEWSDSEPDPTEVDRQNSNSPRISEVIDNTEGADRSVEKRDTLHHVYITGVESDDTFVHKRFTVLLCDMLCKIAVSLNYKVRTGVLVGITNEVLQQIGFQESQPSGNENELQLLPEKYNDAVYQKLRQDWASNESNTDQLSAADARVIVDKLFATPEEIAKAIEDFLATPGAGIDVRAINDSFGHLDTSQQTIVTDRLWEITKGYDTEAAKESLKNLVESHCDETPRTEPLCEFMMCRICFNFNLRDNGDAHCQLCTNPGCNICVECATTWYDEIENTSGWETAKDKICPGCRNPLPIDINDRWKMLKSRVPADEGEREKAFRVIRERLNGHKDFVRLVAKFRKYKDANAASNKSYNGKFKQGTAEYIANARAKAFFESPPDKIIEACGNTAEFITGILDSATANYDEHTRAIQLYNLSPWNNDGASFLYDQIVDSVREGIRQMEAIPSVMNYVAAQDYFDIVRFGNPANKPPSGANLDYFLNDRRNKSLQLLVRAWVGCYECDKDHHDAVRECLIGVGIMPPPKPDNLVTFQAAAFLWSRMGEKHKQIRPNPMGLRFASENRYYIDYSNYPDYPDFIFSSRKEPKFAKYEALFKTNRQTSLGPVGFAEAYQFPVSSTGTASVMARFDAALTGYVAETMFRRTVKALFPKLSDFAAFVETPGLEKSDGESRGDVVDLCNMYVWYATVPSYEELDGIDPYTSKTRDFASKMLSLHAEYLSTSMKRIGDAVDDPNAETSNSQQFLDGLRAVLLDSSFGELCASRILQNVVLRNPLEEFGPDDDPSTASKDAPTFVYPLVETVKEFFARPDNRKTVMTGHIDFAISKLTPVYTAVAKSVPVVIERAKNPQHQRAEMHARPNTPAYKRTPPPNRGSQQMRQRDPRIGANPGRAKAPPPPVKQVPFWKRLFPSQARAETPKNTPPKGPRWRGGASGTSGTSDASAVLGIVLSVCVVVASSVVGSAR